MNTTPPPRMHPQITQAAAAHVACARQKGWTLPELIDPPSVTEDGGGERGEPWTMAVKGLLPYWMPRGRGVENSVDLQCVSLCVCEGGDGLLGEKEGCVPARGPTDDTYTDRNHRTPIHNDEHRGIFLLTAPNMAGKSTLMRALAVAALLGNCGLFVPCTGKTPHGIAAGMVAPAANAAAEEGSRAITRIPRFDNVFVRTASFDVPAEVT